ncbi:MAG TPA: carboxypeptidase-like regulatory domain-containing protein [Thermoanaerobaculia bacterium]|nr:carboxypeptidase-like regulatory domain-containing protein [Thermoanaerobaculia bacterium]
MSRAEAAPIILTTLLLAAAPGVSVVGQEPARPALTGQVVDNQGKPVAGAKVWAGTTSWDEKSHVVLASLPERPAAVTDQEGRFALGKLPPAPALLDVCRDGYVPWRDAGVSPGPLRIQLETATRIAGRALDPSGAPVPGVHVTAESQARPSGHNVLGARCGEVGQRDEAVTDAAGRFTLAPLRADWYTVTAEAPGWQRIPPLRRQTTLDHPVDPLRLVLEPAAFLVGKVVDPDGQPVAGAEITLADEPAGKVPATSSGTDGAFRLDGLLPGRRTVHVEHPDWVALSVDLALSAGENRSDLTLAEPRRFDVRGRVVDPQGEPVAGATVGENTEGGVTGETTTSADGSFVLKRGPGIHALTADKEGYARGDELLPVLDKPVDGVEIRLEEGLALLGHVLGLSPEELRKTSVQVSGGPGIQQKTAVAQDGSWRLELLPAGRYTVEADALLSSGTGLRRSQAQVELSSEDPETSVDLRFSPLVLVRGQLVGPQGEPVGDAWVHLRTAESSTVRSAESGKDGRFTLSAEPGSWIGTVQSTSYVAPFPFPLDIAEGEPVDGLMIHLEAGGAILIRFLGLQPGEWPAMASVTRPEVGHFAPPLGDTIRFTGLAPGDWQVEATLNRPDEPPRKVAAVVTLPPGVPEAQVDLSFAEP